MSPSCNVTNCDTVSGDSSCMNMSAHILLTSEKLPRDKSNLFANVLRDGYMKNIKIMNINKGHKIFATMLRWHVALVKSRLHEGTLNSLNINYIKECWTRWNLISYTKAYWIIKPQLHYHFNYNRSSKMLEFMRIIIVSTYLYVRE